MRFNYFKSILVSAFFLIVMNVSLAKEPLKIGYIYADSIDDYGWNHQHELARQAVDKRLGDEIESNYYIISKSDAKSTIDKLVKENYHMIFVTSHSLNKIALAAARANPKVNFAICDSHYSLDNLMSYSVRYEDGVYLSGVAAAKVSKNKILGVIASLRLPLIYKNINAFALGAQSVDPAIKIKVIWVDPKKDFEKVAESVAVKELKKQGADVILQQTLNPAMLTTAEEEGVWVVGFNNIAKDYAPTKYLTSTLSNWNNFYRKQIEARLANRWNARNVWSGFSEEMIKMTPVNPSVSPEIIKEILNLKKKIKSEKFHPFTGPAYFADGRIFLKDGEVAPYFKMFNMLKLVKGVDVLSE